MFTSSCSFWYGVLKSITREEVLFMRYTTNRTASPQNLHGTFMSNREAHTISRICQFCLYANPFCWGVHVHEVCCRMKFFFLQKIAFCGWYFPRHYQFVIFEFPFGTQIWWCGVIPWMHSVLLPCFSEVRSNHSISFINKGYKIPCTTRRGNLSRTLLRHKVTLDSWSVWTVASI